MVTQTTELRLWMIIIHFRLKVRWCLLMMTNQVKKSQFSLVAPSGGLKHPNMQTKKVSKFNLELFGIFTKKYFWRFSVVKWVKQWCHEQNYALLHENHHFGSKISDF